MTARLEPPAHRFATAPMMDWTDTWCRRFFRLLTRRSLVFTEMVVDGAVIHGDRARHLDFDPCERPLALQLGGAEPARLAEAARIAADWGYDEINLNVGCPSDRVQSGRFGACLMREPSTVAACVAAMAAATATPITVKCRIGVDEQDPNEALFSFVETVAAAGVRRFYVHARKAWLQGLSPKENRSVPPLDYPLVRALKAARPDVEIVLNGGLRSLEQARVEAAGLDGVMLGRAAYETPFIMAAVDQTVFGAAGPIPTRAAVVEGLRALVSDARAAGRRAHAVTRHALGLYHGAPGARAWRRTLSADGARPDAGAEVLDRALAAMSPGAVTDHRAAGVDDGGRARAGGLDDRGLKERVAVEPQ